jgi:hypothetical protein
MASVSERSRPQRLTRTKPALWLVAAIALFVLCAALWVMLAAESLFGPTHTSYVLARAALRFLAGQDFMLLFLTVAGGYALGGIAVKGVSLGATAGTMVLGIALSVWASGSYGVDFELADALGSLFLNLFMFALGMKVGPQVLAGLGRGAVKLVALALLVPLLSTGIMLAIRATSWTFRRASWSASSPAPTPPRLAWAPPRPRSRAAPPRTRATSPKPRATWRRLSFSATASARSCSPSC